MSAPTANVDAPNGQGVGFTHRAKVGGFTYALSSSRAVARRTLALWRWLSSFDSFLPQFCHNCLRTATLGGGPPLCKRCSENPEFEPSCRTASKGKGLLSKGYLVC